MKKNKTEEDELRAEYIRADFPGGLVRGKYAKRLKESSNVIVLKPEIAKAFPNEEAVNNALLSLIDIARKSMRPSRRSTGSARKQVSR
jgi:hypothetical protein